MRAVEGVLYLKRVDAADDLADAGDDAHAELTADGLDAVGAEVAAGHAEVLADNVVVHAERRAAQVHLRPKHPLDTH